MSDSHCLQTHCTTWTRYLAISTYPCSVCTGLFHNSPRSFGSVRVKQIVSVPFRPAMLNVSLICTDIDTIEIRSDEDGSESSKARRTYNYRVWYNLHRPVDSPFHRSTSSSPPPPLPLPPLKRLTCF